MTVYRSNIKSNTERRGMSELSKTLLSILLIAVAFYLSLCLSGKISHSVSTALSLCANVIIPSVFPFIILSDFLYAFLDFSSIKFIGDFFERIFKINRCGIYPFALGMSCGFPLGVKCTTEMYKEGRLTRGEAERLIGFCNNTGPAFLVSGVGVGLRGRIEDGVILYFVMLISAVMVGTLFSIPEKRVVGKENSFRENSFSLTRSIKNAGLGTLNICSYLTFFACTVGLLRNLIGENYVYLSIIPFLEIGSATSILSKTKLLDANLSLIFSAFAVGFSGLSVHLQSLSYISETDLSVKKYFLMKLLQGIISAALTAAYLLIK